MYQTYACARCGFVNPTHARACAECGTPNPHPSPFLPPPPNAIGTPGAQTSGGGPNVAKWVIGLAALGCGGIVVIGVLAAIAIPKFAGVAKQAKEAEVRPTLLQVSVLQDEYRREHGAYAADLALLPGESLGTGPSYGLRYYELEVSEATETDLCVDAVPSPMGRSAEVRSFSMDETSAVFEGTGCTGMRVDGGGYAPPVADGDADGIPAWDATDTMPLPADGAPADEGKPDPASKAPKP